MLAWLYQKISKILYVLQCHINSLWKNKYCMESGWGLVVHHPTIEVWSDGVIVRWRWYFSAMAMVQWCDGTMVWRQWCGHSITMVRWYDDGEAMLNHAIVIASSYDRYITIAIALSHTHVIVIAQSTQTSMAW